ncbi:hypothetical protein WJX79_005673 [Trebouxia sp. C0005]
MPTRRSLLKLILKVILIRILDRHRFPNCMSAAPGRCFKRQKPASALGHFPACLHQDVLQPTQNPAQTVKLPAHVTRQREPSHR